MDTKQPDSPFGSGLNQGTQNVHYGIATPPPPPPPPGVQKAPENTASPSQQSAQQSGENDFYSMSPQEQIAARLARIEDRLTRIEAVMRGHYGVDPTSDRR